MNTQVLEQITLEKMRTFISEWGFKNELFLHGIATSVEFDQRSRQYLCRLAVRHFNLRVDCRVDEGEWSRGEDYSPMRAEGQVLFSILNLFKNGVAAYLKNPERFYQTIDAPLKVEESTGESVIRLLRE